MGEVKEAKIRKVNMKLYPLYQTMGYDLMFFYAIQMLFLMQVKDISASNVVLLGAFFALSSAIVYIPLTLVVSKIGKKNSIVLGNLFSLIYILIYILGTNYIEFIVAEFISAIAFALKGMSESTFLNESIPNAKRKSEIFTKINESGYSKFSYFSAVTMIVSGFLYDINPYIPMICCAICVFLSIIVSANFIDLRVLKEENINKEKETIKVKAKRLSDAYKDLKSSLKFILHSKRLRALFLIIATIWGLLCLAVSYRTAMLESLECSATFIGIIAGLLEFIKGYASTRTIKFHKKHRNKTLTILGLIVTVAFIISGLIMIVNVDVDIQVFIIVMAFILIYQARGIYQVIKNKYLNSFSNSKVLPKIYSIDGITTNIARMIIAFIGSIVLANMDIKYATIFIGIVFTLVVFAISKYMKTRLGLKPEQYKKEDIIY